MIKSLTDKQKLKEFITNKPALQETLKGLLPAEKVTTRNKKMIKETNLNGRDKHIEKIVDQPTTYYISREAKVKKVEDKGCKIYYLPK